MYFPIFIDLSDREILMVGGGTIAARRVKSLCGFAGQITVVAPAVCDAIRSLQMKYPVKILQEPFSETMLDDAGRFKMVLAATDDAALNERIADVCHARGILVNIASRKEACDFYFPSVIRRDPVVIGINASGLDHGLVKRTREELEAALDKEDLTCNQIY